MNETINLNVFCFTASPWINEDAVAAMCGACARVDFYCRFLPAKLTSRFLLPISSRQIDESISTTWKDKMYVGWLVWEPRGRKMRLGIVFIATTCLLLTRYYATYALTIRHALPRTTHILLSLFTVQSIHHIPITNTPVYEQRQSILQIHNPGQLCAVVQQ